MTTGCDQACKLFQPHGVASRKYGTHEVCTELVMMFLTFQAMTQQIALVVYCRAHSPTKHVRPATTTPSQQVRTV